MTPRVLQLLLLCLLIAIAAAWSKEDYEIFKVRDELELAEGPDVTFYDFLGVQPSATVDEILKAFRKKSKALHPDKVKHSFIASRSTAKPTKPGEKKKPRVHVSQGPSDREIQKFVKQASERYTRLGVVRDILRGADRERYDYFLRNGFPKWRGTGYYYSRYRPGLGTVLVGLFLVGGGGAHYFALITSYKRQREFMERYIRHARKTAWGDETGLRGLAGLSQPAAAVPAEEEADPMANLNRRQKRELERQNKKEGKSGKVKAKTPPSNVPSTSGERRRVTAENGKILVVDSVGNVFLEEEDEDGETQQYLLDVNEIHKPTISDTAVVRLPIWVWRRAVWGLLQRTKPALGEQVSHSETSDDLTTEIAVPERKTTPVTTDMSSSQISDSGFEIVDSSGIDREMEIGSGAAGVKKRGKKSKK